MKEAVLEFRIGDKKFGIPTKFIKNLFEIENVKKVYGMPKYVVGLVENNKHIYPLVSLNKIWNISEDNSFKGKSAIVIVFNFDLAIVVDEILKISSAEKKGNEIFEVYEDEGEIVGKLDLEFLKDIKLPHFQNRYEVKKSKKDTKKYLIFKNEEVYVIDVEKVKKIDEKEKEYIEILNLPVYIEPFGKLIEKKDFEKSVIVVEKDKKFLALGVEEILGIEEVEKNEIVYLSNAIFKETFFLNGKTIKVLNNKFLDEKIENHGVVIAKTKKEKTFSTKKSILIVNIAGERFAIDMEDIDEIKECKDIHPNTTVSVENEFIKGIVTTKSGAHYLISFEKIIGRNIDMNNEDCRVIVLKSKENKKAILISNIEDLITIEKENIIYSSNKEFFIQGAVCIDNDIVTLLNSEWRVDEHQKV